MGSGFFQGEPREQPGEWFAGTIKTLLSGNPSKVMLCPMVLRPVKEGLCKISECKSELSLPELLQLNLVLDMQDDSP